jgi:transcriptional regulator
MPKMYIPAAFAERDKEKLHAFMREHSFATLISHGEDGLVASHLPLLLDSAAGPFGCLYGHMARANDQWKRLEGDILAIFSGPHAYISPAWYEDEGTVPTWNYVAVHAYGVLEIVDGREPLLKILRRSVRTYEGPRENPWRLDESTAHVEKLLQAIVGLRVEIIRLEGKWKLGQNHPEERRQRVIRQLGGRSDEDSRAIAALMAEYSAAVMATDREAQ